MALWPWQVLLVAYHCYNKLTQTLVAYYKFVTLQLEGGGQEPKMDAMDLKVEVSFWSL